MAQFSNIYGFNGYNQNSPALNIQILPPTNYVTLDTAQVITGSKTFSNVTFFTGTVDIAADTNILGHLVLQDTELGANQLLLHTTGITSFIDADQDIAILSGGNVTIYAPTRVTSTLDVGSSPANTTLRLFTDTTKCYLRAGEPGVEAISELQIQSDLTVINGNTQAKGQLDIRPVDSAPFCSLMSNCLGGGAFNLTTQAGDSMLLGRNIINLTSYSTTKVGLRVTQTTVTLGAGGQSGTGLLPTSYIQVDNGNSATCVGPIPGNGEANTKIATTQWVQNVLTGKQPVGNYVTTDTTPQTITAQKTFTAPVILLDTDGTANQLSLATTGSTSFIDADQDIAILSGGNVTIYAPTRINAPLTFPNTDWNYRYINNTFYNLHDKDTTAGGTQRGRLYTDNANCYLDLYGAGHSFKTYVGGVNVFQITGADVRNNCTMPASNNSTTIVPTTAWVQSLFATVPPSPSTTVFNGLSIAGNISAGTLQSVRLGNDILNYGTTETGGANTHVGSRTGRVLTTGFSNTLVGHSAGDVLTTGYNNTYVGRQAGYNLTYGYNNIGIGNGAGALAVGNNNCIFIGNDATSYASTSQAIVIGEVNQTQYVQGQFNESVYRYTTSINGNWNITLSETLPSQVYYTAYFTTGLTYNFFVPPPGPRYLGAKITFRCASGPGTVYPGAVFIKATGGAAVFASNSNPQTLVTSLNTTPFRVVEIASDGVYWYQNYGY
jgi:hypothetical protein